MKSIYFKNFTATAAMVMVSFLILGIAFVFLGRSYVINDARDKMEANAEEVSRSAQALTREGELNGWELRMTISAVSKITGNQIFISDPAGVIISCSDMNIACDHLGRQIDPAVFIQLRSSETFNQMTNLYGFYDTPHYVVAQAIQTVDGAGVMGYVFITSDSASIVESWYTFVWVFIAASIAVMLLSLLLSLMTAKRMAQPLDEMARASRKFAHGDFSVRVKEDGRTDEVGALVSAFNSMADSLEAAEQRRNEFIANVSHELKTPMTTIAGFADGILDGTIPKEDEEKYLISIRDETRRLSRLVRDMLSASQTNARAADPSRRTVFDLTELVLQTLLSFESRATAKNLDVDPQLPDSHILVLADKDAITQVIYNLLDNAVKFAREGSCLTLRLYKDNGKAYVSIKDEGETIPPDDLPFIFDRFHKSDRSRSLDKDGVGLGLYLVKSIINSHDEDIAVRSEDGVTEFVFTLKLAEK